MENLDQFIMTPKSQKILHDQIINESEPGSILHNFDTLLRFIGPGGIAVRGKYNFFPLNSLSHLNEQLKQPIELDLKRPQQKSYSHLHGLYLLLRASGIAYMACYKLKGTFG